LPTRTMLEHQLRWHDPIGFDERADVVHYDRELPRSHAYADDALQRTSNALLASIFSASSR
jgi:hypothetical protein